MVLSCSHSATLTIADAGLSAPSALRSGDDATSTRITLCEHRRQFAETGSVGRSGFRFARRPIRIAGVISLHHPKPIHRQSGWSLFWTISETFSDESGKQGAPDRQKTERPPQLAEDIRADRHDIHASQESNAVRFHLASLADSWWVQQSTGFRCIQAQDVCGRNPDV